MQYVNGHGYRWSSGCRGFYIYDDLEGGRWNVIGVLAFYGGHVSGIFMRHWYMLVPTLRASNVMSNDDLDLCLGM